MAGSWCHSKMGGTPGHPRYPSKIPWRSPTVGPCSSIFHGNVGATDPLEPGPMEAPGPTETTLTAASAKPGESIARSMGRDDQRIQKHRENAGCNGVTLIWLPFWQANCWLWFTNPKIGCCFVPICSNDFSRCKQCKKMYVTWICIVAGRHSCPWSIRPARHTGVPNGSWTMGYTLNLYVGVS